MNFTTPAALFLLILLPLAYLMVRPAKGRPDRQPYSGRLGLVLRLFILALLVFSLAGTQLVRAVDDLAVVFLVDASDSMSSDDLARAESFVREAVADMRPNDRAGVILFGANALVEQPVRLFGPGEELPSFASQPQRMQTDLAEAMRLGLALMPPDAARRLVILSDGAETTGDSIEAARLAAAAGVSIDTIYLDRPASTGEILLHDVRAPARVRQGETFRLELVAESTIAGDAVIRILDDTGLVREEPVSLRPGINNYVVRLQAGEAAFRRYQVVLSPVNAADSVVQNNSLAAFTEIVGQPRVLLVAAGVDARGQPIADEAAQLAQALAASGLLIDRVTPQALSPVTADLADFAAIVLVNVNARDLAPRKMEALQAYVRDLGGGLVAVGGPDSYGVGGYFGTPLEDALPLDMQIHDQDRFPEVSMVMVLDRSGSMAQEEGGVPKIRLAAEGAVRALELLNDFDELTIIPVDEAPNAAIGPVTAGNRDEAVDLIRRMSAGGGGIFVRAGLEAAADSLAESDNLVRHIIVLADGADSEQKEGVPELIEQLTADGVTVSMVSIGTGPDTQWLQEMAELGNGRFHVTDEAANLPQIFTQETLAIRRNYVIEERFFPTLAVSHPILTGIAETPPLYGYIGTSAKTTAHTVLLTHLQDPLLAAWQYGLGRSVAWTSDATGRWARDWVPWDGYAPFWNQVVRWTFGARPDGALEATIRLDGEQAVLTVEARRDEFLNDLSLTANVIGPDGRTQAFDLQQTGLGRYEASFSPQAEGVYVAGIGLREGSSAAGDGLRATTGWVLGYSPEYAALEGDPARLASIAELTSGRVLDAGSGTASVFDHDLAAAPAFQPIWPWLVLIATLLLPVDVAARRLALTRRDWARAWERIRKYESGIRNEEKSVGSERPEGMERLLRAKEQRQGDTRRPASEEARSLGTATLPVAPGDTVTAEEPPEAPAGQDESPDETLAARLRRRRNL